MGEVADRLAALAVSVTSPDGNITAWIRGSEPDQLMFRPDAYERYTEAVLAHQLARTAELLYVARDREVGRVMDAAGLTRATLPEHARDEPHHRYLVELRALAAAGTGHRELVTFEVEGMAHWRCQIADGALRSLSEAELVAEALAAATDLLRNARFEKGLLRNQFFGTRLAPPVKVRLARQREQGSAR